MGGVIYDVSDAEEGVYLFLLFLFTNKHSLGGCIHFVYILLLHHFCNELKYAIS